MLTTIMTGIILYKTVKHIINGVNFFNYYSVHNILLYSLCTSLPSGSNDNTTAHL